MVDNSEADDKIIAVLSKDYLWEEASYIGERPSILVERLRHYFLTFKQIDPAKSQRSLEFAEVFGTEHARKVIGASLQDYAVEIPERMQSFELQVLQARDHA